jgi:hypothetical protein
MLLNPILAALEEELRTDFDVALAGLLPTARTRLEGALAEVARERAKGLAEVATQKGELRREMTAMHTHAEQQQGRVKLNIGGYRFQTLVQSLRCIKHTFFDAYFSGRYAQDVCEDGSIFVDRDGEHFGHVLEYMRDGVVSVAAPGACPSVSLLRLLKREFGYYCIELVAEEPAAPDLTEAAFVVGGRDAHGNCLSSMEHYDASSRQWSAAVPMTHARTHFGGCVIVGELYVTGGMGNDDEDDDGLSSVEKSSPSTDTWSAVAPMPAERSMYSGVAIRSVMYVLGGSRGSYKFDSTQGIWSRAALMSEVRIGCAACAVGSDIFVFGGIDAQNARQASVFKYDTVANEWSTLTPMPQVCRRHSVSVLERERSGRSGLHRWSWGRSL